MKLKLTARERKWLKRKRHIPIWYLALLEKNYPKVISAYCNYDCVPEDADDDWFDAHKYSLYMYLCFLREVQLLGLFDPVIRNKRRYVWFPGELFQELKHKLWVSFMT